MDISQETNKRATILVVDDTPDNLSFVSGILKDQYRVKVANNGEKAISIAQSATPPDLILLDIMMPDMDGYEVCQKLKADPQTREIPIIFLTAKAEIEDERKGLELGAIDYIIKPISPPILMVRVNTQLSLKASYDNLRDLLRLREDMVNMIVHDLRNPLSNILIMAEMLESNPELPPAIIQKRSNLILISGQRLKYLVDDLLIRAKLESNKIVLALQSVNLDELCKFAIADMKDIAARENIQILLQHSHATDRHVNLDPMLFRRTIDNLLSNAIKFAPMDSEITLTVDYADESRARVMVADLGGGVDQDIRETIFEKYEVGTLMKGVSQTGLGLAFCKIAIEAHGGSISITDNQPQGSIFTVEISV
ncbi:MAG: hybrid sensor histidine kinase/response regulator [Pseudanabaena sp. CAN_BIN31]|nr:hybrid sensor histidine kinase/response regulator [Pseudanabaena sp. CAN_BIN31]